jgi:hypothetical protein
MNKTLGLRKNSSSALQAVAGDPSLDSQQKHKEPMAWKLGRRAVLVLLLAGCACLAYSQSVTAGSAEKSGSSSSAGPPSELYSCINDGFDQQLTTYRDFAYQKPVRCAGGTAAVVGSSKMQSTACMLHVCLPTGIVLQPAQFAELQKPHANQWPL